jgi:hypothetical protein
MIPFSSGLWEALSYNVYKWLGIYDPGVERKQLCEKLLRFKHMLTYADVR